MAEHAVPVDLFNPGQVFACVGLLEAAEVLLGMARGGFDWSREREGRTEFRVWVGGAENPVAVVLDFLARAEVKAVAPAGSGHRAEKWNVPIRTLDPGAPFPYPKPKSPAALPASLEADGHEIVIEHWADGTRRDSVKFWAGSRGLFGATLAARALVSVRDRLEESVGDPFGLSAPQSNGFRFDWRRDYIPLDAGFSPNEHSNVTMVGYPLVEVLAAIGLTHARPKRVSKLEYRYGVVSGEGESVLLDPILVRAALGCAPLPFSRRTFRMELGWPGQENQARCIVDVTEETS